MSIDIIIKPSFKDIIRKGFKDPVYFAEEILEAELHDDQKLCLRGMCLKEHIGITCGNRWGKGDLIAIYSAYINAYKPVIPKFKNKSINTLNTSISQDQANIVFDKFNELYLDKPKFSWLIKDVKKSPFPNIKFKNGMRWWFRNASQNGKYLEGRSYLYANFDEADLQTDFYTFVNDILWPRLWDFGGWLSWTTTPRRGKKNAYKVWSELNKDKKLNPKFFSFNGDSRKNTFLHPSAIEKMNKLPTRLLNKNVLGLYEDSDGQISNDHCDYCEYLSTGIERNPTPRRKYLNIWDFARSSTFNVGITLDITDDIIQLVSWERMQDKGSRNKKYWAIVIDKVNKRHKKWRGRTICDATGLGDVVCSSLNIPHLPLKLNTKNREEIIEEGLSSIQLGNIGLPLEDVHQVIDQRYWCLRDELTDFDDTALDHVIWDFVCCIFIGVWYASGKRPRIRSNKNKKPSPPRTVAKLKGVSKYEHI